MTQVWKKSSSGTSEYGEMVYGPVRKTMVHPWTFISVLPKPSPTMWGLINLPLYLPIALSHTLDLSPL